MLHHIKGTLIEKKQDIIVVDVNGIGFEISVSNMTYLSIPDEGDIVTLYLHTQVREDDIHLYGFSTSAEKALFKLLISVSGIGPKVARNILSNIQIDELINAVVTKDLPRLSSVPGLGKKTAEKIIVELKEKMGNLQLSGHHTAGNHAILSDAVSALINLGYKQQQSRDVVEEVLKDNQSLDIGEVIRLSLKRLSK